MCRLFAFSFHADTVNNSKHSFVDSFIKLSEHGAVLPTSSPGHHDGWGIVSYSSSKDIAVHYKSVSSAHCDTQFRSDVLFKDSNSRSGLVHLRKKTVGETLIENTHPFVDGVYSFIHNGTISHSGTYANLSAVCEGATDSERLFRRFLEIKTIKGVNSQEAFSEMIHEVRNIHPEYSALNSILHDGEHILVSRSINVHNKHHPEQELLDYYTLYVGNSTSGDVLITSEMLPGRDVRYTLLPNHSISCLTIADNMLQTVVFA